MSQDYLLIRLQLGTTQQTTTSYNIIEFNLDNILICLN